MSRNITAGHAFVLALGWLILLGVSSGTSRLIAAESLSSDEVVADFLANYCVACHDTATREGDREFESFAFPILDHAGLINADEIIDQVTLRQMPPQDAEQPSDEERLGVIESLRSALQSARNSFASTGGRTVLRRLSHRQYENTLATLLDRRVDTLGLTADFPTENTSHHLDTIGSELVTSGFLLDQYFQAADRLIETRLGQPSIGRRTWHFRDHFVQYEELNGPHKSVFNFEYLCLYEQPNTDTRQGGYGHIEDFLEGVPVSGLYDIAVHAQAMHRDTHYDPKIFRIDLSEPFQLAVVPGDVRKGHIHYPQAIEPILGKAIVPDDAPEWISFRVWLEAGQTPRFIFPNGPYESRASIITLNERYKDELKNPKKGVSRSSLLREGKLPHIRIGEIKIEGPIAEPGGPREEIAVFGPGGFQADQALEQLQAFAHRAFRRPLENTDRTRIESLYQQRLHEGAAPRQAALDAVKLILCSPSFLYLQELTDDGDTQLNDYDLATRIAYALWAAPPDDRLMALADEGRLGDDAVLRREVRRMLSDDRIDAFVEAFLDNWLGLRDIGSAPPSRPKNKDYYGRNLPVAMKHEVRLFLRDLLDRNASALDLLSSRHTFVNVHLAELYGLPDAETLRQADGFRRVSLPDADQRGGLLGMAAVLTVSANGVETSPVTRGVWVLENILGDTPPPPPDEVPAIDASTAGAKTIREKLERHREDQACNVCHRKIDPMGFSLETFDPIGRWRDRYRPDKGTQVEVDASGRFPSGELYANFAEFKEILLATRTEPFLRHLVETLLAYTTGRLMEPVDRYAVDDILLMADAADNGLRSLVENALLSPIVRSR
ncbi:MAG: DUF1592 domain-containing protein [Planctomycetota bacterium]